jgi:hypothetical protein
LIFDCDVYYVYFHLVDSRAVALEDASLVLAAAGGFVIDTQTADVSGNVSVRSPRGEHAVLVYWKNVEVYDGNVTVDKSDRYLTLTCDVYYLQLTAQDVRSLPLQSATITLTYNLSGEIFNSDYTNIAGQMTSRLPHGNYDIEVYWRGVLVCTVMSYSLNQGVDQQFTLPCKVYYLTVKARDNGGAPVPDVLITVAGTTNSIVDSQRTSKGGSTEFRLPVGNYNITGRLQESFFLREVDQTVTAQVVLDSSKEEKLEFSEYPPMILATPGFWIIAGLLMAILAIIVTIVLLRRKKDAGKEADEKKTERAGGAKTPPPPAPEDEEDKKELEEGKGAEEGEDKEKGPEDEKAPEDVAEPDIEKGPEAPGDEKTGGKPEGPKDEASAPPAEASAPVGDAPPVDDKPPMDAPPDVAEEKKD